MPAFLISGTDGDWFDLPKVGWEEVYLPKSVAAEHVKGYDVPAIRVLGCDVTFSYEDPRIQLSFVRGTMDEETASRIVTEILDKITRATGRQGKVVQISV